MFFMNTISSSNDRPLVLNENQAPTNKTKAKESDACSSSALLPHLSSPTSVFQSTMAGRLPGNDGPPTSPAKIGFRPPPGLADSSEATSIPRSRFWPEQRIVAPPPPVHDPGHVLDLRQLLSMDEELLKEKDRGSPSEVSSSSVTQKLINSGTGIMAKAKALLPGSQSLPRWGSSTLSRVSATAGQSLRAPHASQVEQQSFAARDSKRWHAVWCHERCYKSDASPVRSVLTYVLGRHNAELVCQKTACKFKLWLEGEQDGFYLLISDWRQLKPCMDIFAEESVPQPGAVIILCEQAKVYSKAQSWNQARPEGPFPVYVLKTEDAGWQDQLEAICLQYWEAPGSSGKQSAASGEAPFGTGSTSAAGLQLRSSTRFSL